jgi:hypothetical protein
MVTRRAIEREEAAGWLMVDAMVALAILILALIPLAYSYEREHRLARAYYQRAVAMEIVDGELEVLRAGAWRRFTEGAQPYTVRAESATNLPPGRFVLTRAGRHLRLEWLPEGRRRGSPVSREAQGR